MSDPAQEPDRDRRPGTVTAAGVVTLVMAGLATLGFGVAAVMVVTSSGDGDGGGDGGGDGQAMADFVGAVAGLLAVWSLVAVVLAVFAMRRSQVARVLLVVSAAVVALLSLVALASVVSLVTLLGAVAVIVLLFTGGAQDWYAARGAPQQRQESPPPVQPRS
ncbi:hypothetical protein [Nocardioides pantholopis]|uniref:hypothetical protein n=1 Tax=Nocardioides pantholopis TaxID=2483798 RepID=UPI000F0736BF|nr:hypothetical protein [Nocardioides pantholopis]